MGHFGGGVVPPLPPRLVPAHLGLTAQLIDPDLIVPARGDKRLQYSGILDDVGGCRVGFVFSGGEQLGRDHRRGMSSPAVSGM